MYVALEVFSLVGQSCSGILRQSLSGRRADVPAPALNDDYKIHKTKDVVREITYLSRPRPNWRRKRIRNLG